MNSPSANHSSGNTTNTWRTPAHALCAFALPALCLSLPSGYSWGGVLLCALGLACSTQWATAWRQPALRTWVVAVTLMGLLLVLDAWQTHPFKINALDRPLKFALALVAVPSVLCAANLSQRSLRWGLWVGALTAASTAWWQLNGLHWDRAWGHTNAILFGDLALLLGIWSWAWARQERGWHHWFGMAAALAGGYACIASESRGGWWLTPVLIVLVLATAQQHQQRFLADTPPRVPAQRFGRARMAATALALVLLLGSQWALLQSRAMLAWQEATLHQTAGVADNSIGQRLAHWDFAWHMGLAKPWTGWGEQGYQIEKKRQAQLGSIPLALQSFEHAHNEWLDMWAKRGMAGVLVLALFFGLPARLYWRTLRRARTEGLHTELKRAAHTSAVCGLAMVVGYVGFGMTQVMFAHNAGTMMYLFMNLLWLAPIVQASNEQRNGDRQQPQAQVDADPQANAGQ